MVTRSPKKPIPGGRPFFLQGNDLRLLLFGGKGGVGKTTCATASACTLALNRPRRTFLLVSTDPAHSLSDSLAGSPPPPNLEILELDAKKSLAEFKKNHAQKLQAIAARGTFLDNEDIARFLDLSLPGLDELMAILEIGRWVEEEKYDCVVADTAPTGHTIRLLQMAKLIQKWLGALDALLAKHRYMKKVFSGSYQHDELDDFITGLSGSVTKVQALLKNSAHCRFVPVMVAEVLSIRETLTLLDELKRLKMSVTDIVLNMVSLESACPVCLDRRRRQMRELENFWEEAGLNRFAIWGVPLYPEEVRGIHLLKMFWEEATKIDKPSPVPLRESVGDVPGVEAATELPSREMVFLLFGGKGGVGKTTLSCATALRMAQELKDREVFLFSTDPAHSLSFCLGVEVGPTATKIASNLTAMEIDAQAEFETLKSQYLVELEAALSNFHNLDLAFDQEVMERILDLAPTGLDEIMALNLVMDQLAQGSYDLFILDSAPTGHLLRLLELPELVDQWLKVFFDAILKYKKVLQLPGLSRRLVQMSKNLKKLRALLNDPERSAVYLVSILSEMAFQESKDLVSACRRMDVGVPVLFFNLATPFRDCPVCSALHKRERLVRRKFDQSFPGIKRVLIYRQGDPRGLEKLSELGRGIYHNND